MAGSFQDMLKLIRDLTRTLEDLTNTQKAVAAAVRTDDLEKLGECMKQEQALSLALRNADQRRIKLQAELGLENIRLAQLPEHVPDEAMRQEIKAAGEALTTQYRVLQSAAEVARSALECSLHEVEGMMTNLGFDPVQTKEQTASVSGAHTDFHA
jgi:septal ring factor EnvC (AmiA/AmiB activator)